MGGAQAQLLSAAQLSLRARVSRLTPGDVDQGLWKRRSLALAWCMRRTLFVVPARDLAIFVRGTAARVEKEIRWLHNRGVRPALVERLIEATLDVLNAPLTRTEIARRVARTLNVRETPFEGGGWGGRRAVPAVKVEGLTYPAYWLLHLAGARGVLCSGPREGTEATFVRADAWVPRWRDVGRDEAESALLHRFLRSFGPATIRDYVAWTRVRYSDAKAVWERELRHLVPVEVGGSTAWILRGDRRELETADVDRPCARLLPYFDSFILGHDQRGHLLDPRWTSRVYRDQGWVAPVVLIDGRVRGVWSHEPRPDLCRVTIRKFGPFSRPESAAIRREADDVARFLGSSRAEVRFGSS